MTSLHRPSLLTSALALTLVGCGGSSSTADAGADAPSITMSDAAMDAPSVAMSDAAADAPITTSDAGPVCGYVDTIDRSCTTDGDCLVRLHQTDCCGNSVMIGIASGAADVYGTSEPACMASYPACECPAMLPTTDSGETVTDTAAVLAACVSRGPRNVCLTYVSMRPADGR
ncbi:MAG: hypothetical protein K1X94_31515 [Sandaracinaceae bacterium]|nr:hypothetical protein [Sandaracinaceae bacterium]